MPAETAGRSEDDFSHPSRDKGPWLLRPGNLERVEQVIRFFPTDGESDRFSEQFVTEGVILLPAQ